MTDLERYIWIFDNTGVKYEVCRYENGTDLSISSESISTYGEVNLSFNKEGKFVSFEIFE
jgi:hypothetical protein